VCLLIVASRVIPGCPLLIGANRDEFLDRPAQAMIVLQAGGPRVLGGQDQLAGGTWLAVNEHGLFAGLTNQPLGEQRDPTRRSRGELPLALAAHATPADAVKDLVAHHQPADYNGCWLLVGDRASLWYIDFTGAVSPEPVELPAGLYVLDNRPLGDPSPKVERVRQTLGPLSDRRVAVAGLSAVLADHQVVETVGPPGNSLALANCIHREDYGTRSSCRIECSDDPAVPPQVWVADGPPCTEPWVDVSSWWTEARSP
jgi:uncharacterized protein with NRDE domain